MSASHSRALDFSNAVLDNAGALVIVMDRTGRIVAFNRACERLSGYTFAEVEGKFPWDTVLPADIAAAVRAEAFDRLVQQPGYGTARYANHWQSKSGQRYLIDWYNTVLHDPDGNVEYVVALGIDITARHDAEQQLRQTTDLLTSIVEHIPNMIFMKDARDLRFVLFNRAGEELIGFKRAELIGKNDYDFFAKDQADFFTAKDRDVLLRTGFVDIPEEPIDTRHGTRRILHTKKIALRDEHGAPRFLLGISEDITERKRAEAALRDSEARLREAQRIARLGSWELDLTTNRLVWSDEIFRIFEIDKERFGASYEAFLNAIHPDDRDAVNAAYTGSLRTRTPYSITHRLRMPDGTIKWVHEQCESFFDADGKPLRSVGTVQDITERIRIEHELATFKTTLDQTLDCVFMFDAATLRFIYVNQGAVEQVGYTRDELLRMTPLDIKPDYDEKRFRALIAPLVSGERAELRFDTIHRHKDGHDIPVGIFLQYVHPNGEPPRFVAVVRDISEQLHAANELRRLNESLEQRVAERTRELAAAKDTAERANRAKSEFLARMSHELRTPMNAILGFAQILELETLSPDARDSVRDIRHAGEQLLELINELLDLSRIEAGKLAVTPRPVSVWRAIEDAIQTVQPMLKDRQITVVNHCERGPDVLADPTRLRQILLNLLSNAGKYNHRGGQIRCHCKPITPGRLRLAVSDTGPGIAPEKLSRLFQPFERLGAEFSSVDGSGIGLALSHRLAELMGGSMGAESAPGQGSTFWLELPTTPAQEPAVPRENSEAPTGITVLYVEDNAANRRLVEAMIRRRGNVNLVTATDGVAGLDLARRLRPHLVLLDIHLPGLDGYAVLDALRADATTRAIPVLALSADAMEADIQKGLRAGFRTYLTKPLQMDTLTAALDEALADSTGR